MASVPVTAFVMGECDFIIEDDNYSAALSSAAIQVDQGTVDWAGMAAGSSFTFPTTPKYSIPITYAQDWASDDSLSVYLWTNKGQTKNVTFAPKKGGRSWTATVIITSGNVGGALNSVADASVTLAVIGEPVMGEIPTGA
ncbi:hypothetical protein DOE76_13930 [Leifsonia sp. ku-ls]|nr:hypothetical protein DOE76_13930 [Leifsonia sp. ku-ls]